MTTIILIPTIRESLDITQMISTGQGCRSINDSNYYGNRNVGLVFPALQGRINGIAIGSLFTVSLLIWWRKLKSACESNAALRKLREGN